MTRAADLSMGDLSRMLIGLGLLLIVVGALIALGRRFHLPLGRLPGDFTWRGRNATVWFPLTTSIVVSVLLSLLSWLIHRLRS